MKSRRKSGHDFGDFFRIILAFLSGLIEVGVVLPKVMEDWWLGFLSEIEFPIFYAGDEFAGPIFPRRPANGPEHPCIGSYLQFLSAKFTCLWNWYERHLSLPLAPVLQA